MQAIETIIMKSNLTQTKLALDLLNKHKAVSTIQFRAHGIMSPAQVIQRLREKGANFNVSRVNFLDHQGIVHFRVAVYTLKGWNDE